MQSHSSSEPLALSRAALLALERRAALELDLPEQVLMETAGAGAARALLARWSPPRGRVVILAGKGNNGADGGVMARHLLCQGVCAAVLYICAEQDQVGQARSVRRASQLLGLAQPLATPTSELRPVLSGLGAPDVLVDALLGTGSSGPVRAELSQWIELANVTKGPLRMAIDLPSGLDPDTGLGLGSVFRADFTATFLARKLGFASEFAKAHTGEVEVLSLGLPLFW